MKEITTIAISRETKLALDEIGNKGQTYDKLIVELIKRWNEWT